MLLLNSTYETRDGSLVTIYGSSHYFLKEKEHWIFTGKELVDEENENAKHYTWNEKGRLMSNVLFGNDEEHDKDILNPVQLT